MSILLSRLALCLLFWNLSYALEAKILYSFADIAEKSILGVVNIRTKTYVRKDPSLDLYQFFLNGRVPRGESTTSLGSGVIINNSGQIITNYHVIKDANKIDVLFAKSKNIVQATVLGVDVKTDLALLQVKSKVPFVPLAMGNSDLLRQGDIVLAFGNPFGYSHTLTGGLISAKGRVLGAGPYDDFLQTDAAIHPGNSGGPLLDVRGRVVGINTAVSQQGAGIGFAIPINLAKAVIYDLQRYGKVIRPWLGIVGLNVLTSEDLGEHSDPNGIFGVIVSNLIIDGPAYQTGIKIGDLIMGLGGHKVYDLNSLQKMLFARKPMESVSVKIYRRGRGFLQVSIKLEEMPKNKDLPQEADLL